MWFCARTAAVFSNPKAKSRRINRPKAQARRTRQLFLEGLEDRRLLAFNVLAVYAAGDNPTDLGFSQMDSGSQLDLVLANNSPGQGSVRLGNADGTFNNPQSTGTTATSVATGDLDDNGVTDLVSIAASVMRQIGNGDGTFQPPQSVSLPPQSAPGNPDSTPLPQTPRSVATGDLNDDGKLDLVVGGQTTWSEYRRILQCGYYSCDYFGYYVTQTDGYVNVLMGNGDANFAAPAVYPLGGGRSPDAIAIGDLSGDGDADVLTAGSAGLTALLGNGAGALAAPVHSGAGTLLKSVSLGDIDGDGRLDALTGWSNTLTVAKGQGNGAFTLLPSVNMGHSVDSAVMGDVNGDGKLDLVAAGNAFTCTSSGYYGCYGGDYSGQASVILGDGAGGFSLPIASPLGTDFNAAFADVALANITGDSLPELVTIERTTGLAIVATNDGDWLAPVNLSMLGATVTEGQSGTVNAVFDITLNAPSTRDVTVDYATAELNATEEYWYGGAAATAGIDYTVMAGTLTIPAGQTSGAISVPVRGDRVGELNELFFLNLGNPTYAILGNSRAVGTIVDDEPYVSMDNTDAATVMEGDSGTRALTFRVVLSAASGIAVSVDFVTNEGSAEAGTDYLAATGTVTFAPGQTEQTFTVLVNGDTQAEFDEYFSVNLMNATNASIGNALGYGNIFDDDSVPEISISDASSYEGNKGSRSMTFVVSLSQPSTQRVRVNYKTANGAARTSDNDYVAKTGTITFNPGQTTKSITIAIKGDKKYESDEQFYVNLSGASGAPINDGQGEGFIFNDDGATTVRGWRNGHAASVDAAFHDGIFSDPKRRHR